MGFGQWMTVGVPLMILYLAIAWLLLTRVFHRLAGDSLGRTEVMRERIAALGPASRDEWLAGLVFALVALVWMSGDSVRSGKLVLFTGWRERVEVLSGLTDAAVGLVGALVLFLLPAVRSRKAPHDVYAVHGEASSRLMDWSFTERRVPWGILLLIGGGFALASGVGSSGLSAIIGDAMTGLGSLPAALLIGVVVLMVCLLSELGSNTATASLTLPILAAMAERWGMDPQDLLWPAALGASLGFMLPVASPMQSIVFGSGRIPMRAMVRVGIWMDLVGVGLLMLFFAL